MRALVSHDYAAKLAAPFAVLGIRTAGGAVTGIEYLPPGERAQAPADALAERACRQLERYLADPEFRFTVPLAPAGTAFQRRVWDALAAIPVGESRTYGEIARSCAPRRARSAAPAAPTRSRSSFPAIASSAARARSAAS